MIKSVYRKYKIKAIKALFIVKYFLFHHQKICKKLTAYGLTDIKIYRINRWYIGLGKYKTTRYYYKANLDKTKCFVKLAIKDRDIKREIYINRYITGFNFSFSPKTMLYDYGDDGSAALLVTEFLEGEAERFTIPECETTFESICKEFEYIHSCFQKHSIVHGDIHHLNLLLSKDNHIKIIDWAVGWVPGSEKYDDSYGNRERVGTYCIESGNTKTFDHAYAFLRMLDEKGISDYFKQKECYKRIERLVGAHTFVLSR